MHLGNVNVSCCYFHEAGQCQALTLPYIQMCPISRLMLALLLLVLKYTRQTLTLPCTDNMSNKYVSLMIIYNRATICRIFVFLVPIIVQFVFLNIPWDQILMYHHQSFCNLQFCWKYMISMDHPCTPIMLHSAQYDPPNHQCCTS